MKISKAVLIWRGISVCGDFCEIEAGSLFELFYRKAAPLHVVSVEMTGFSKSIDKDGCLKNGKMVIKTLNEEI